MTEEKNKKKFRSNQRNKAIAKREASLTRKNAGQSDSAVQIAFSFYVIAIAAKLASIDAGKRDINSEIDSFKEIFCVPESEVEKIEVSYLDAVEDNVAAKHYALQLNNLFPKNRLLLEELLDNLLSFADADSAMNSNKVVFLREITLALKFNENYFGRALRKHLLISESNPFKLLSVSKSITYVDLKKVYRRAIKDCHPDKFLANDMAQELRDIAHEQFVFYTQAYEAIKSKKGFNRKGKIKNDS